MAFLAPAAPFLASAGGSLLGSLFGKKSKPRKQGVLGQMAESDLGASSDYNKQIMSNPAEATATTTSDLGKQFQQGVNFNARNVTRGGGSSAKIAEAPFQLASAAKGQQILARMGAAKNLGELGGTAGRLDLGQQDIDLQRTQQNRQFWGDIGSTIGGFLTQPGGLAKGSILGRMGGILSKSAPGFSSDPSSSQNYEGGSF